MKHLFLLLFCGFGFLAAAQKVEIEPNGKGQFIVVSTFERESGEVTIRRSAPLDTARAKREIVDFSASINRQIGEKQLEISRLLAEKARAEEAFSAIEGATIEDEISEKLAPFFVGEYAFSLRDRESTLKIGRGDSERANRLLAWIDDGERGTLKIEGQGAAIILDVFLDGKGKPIDLRFTQVDGGVFVSEIDGEKIIFKKTSEKEPE